MNKIRLSLLIFLIISIGGCTPKGCSFLPKVSLAIVQYNLEKNVDEEGELSAQIVGVARNDGSAQLQYAEVIGKFYSQDGTLLATGVAKPIDEEGKLCPLDPGQIWEFTVPYSSAPRDAHPSLNILSSNLNIDSSGAWVSGEAENNGDVILSFAEITAHFFKADNTELNPDQPPTATTAGLGVGEIWEYTIYYAPRDPEDVGYVNYAQVEVTDTDYEPVPTQEVDHATAQVGTLRGSTVMP